MIIWCRVVFLILRAQTAVLIVLLSSSGTSLILWLIDPNEFLASFHYELFPEIISTQSQSVTGQPVSVPYVEDS